MCDIENIRGIFHNKYGADIDFSGYIDKFYSIDIFEYNFKMVIAESLNEYYRMVDISNAMFKEAKSLPSHYLTNDLTFILSHLIYANSLSMRNFINSLKSKRILDNYEISEARFHTLYSKTTPILIILDFLENIFGSYENTITGIHKAIKMYGYYKFNDYISYLRNTVGNLVMLIDNKNNKLQVSEKDYIYINEELDIKVHYKINRVWDYGVNGEATCICNSKEVLEDAERQSKFLLIDRFPYFQILELAFRAKKGLKNKYISHY